MPIESPPLPTGQAELLVRAERIAVGLVQGQVPAAWMRPYGNQKDENGVEIPDTPYEYDWKVACTAVAIAKALGRAATPRDATSRAGPDYSAGGGA